MKKRVKKKLEEMIEDLDKVEIGDEKWIGIVWVNEKIRKDLIWSGGGCLGKGGIKEIMRRRSGEEERVIRIRRIDKLKMIGKLRDSMIWKM